MGTYADMMSRLTLTVKSPDGAISATLSDRSRVDLTFRPGAYEFYTEDEPALARQLAGTMRLLWVGRRRASLAALSTALGHEVTAAESTLPARREFEARRDALVIEGRSAHVTAKTRGWSEWRFALANGLTRRLDEEDFAAEIRTVITSLLADYTAKSRALMEETYGPRPA